MPPRITEIVDIEHIMELRFRPALRAGSAHLMTPAELEEATVEARRRYEANPRGPNRLDSLNRFIAEQDRRKRETTADRANRLRRRIAWEVAQDRREEKAKDWWRYNDAADRY